MLTCQEVTRLITDYLEGKLSWKDVLRFQLHLGMCTHCRRYLRDMKVTMRTLGMLPRGPIAAETMDLLMQRFRNW
jgi:predicted anti-sigma-YlaC factor YlaD